MGGYSANPGIEGEKDQFYLGPNWIPPSTAQTQVSSKRQDAQPGQNSIMNTKQFDLDEFEALDKRYHDQLHFKDDTSKAYPFTCAKNNIQPYLVIIKPFVLRIIWMRCLIQQ